MHIKELSKGAGWEVFSTRLARGIEHLIVWPERQGPSGHCGPTRIGFLFVKVRFSRCLFPIVQGPSTRGKDVS